MEKRKATFKGVEIEEGSTTNGEIYIDPEINNDNSTTSISIDQELFQISPNPSNGFLNISSSKNKISSIQIYNQLGSIAWVSKFETPTLHFSQNLDFPNGTYFLKIKSQGGKSQILKWVVQK